ncbi:hypothetical protein ABB26_09970 [Stenotrophomonas humi]|uniref:Uncharacterized protein n=1 Tax=Stenotrophomonas humi TaxID=405444 RepID=A0A0R0C3G9_9GAMM|nr:hypothetical protein [Stenotrophomonas humi]KRG63899.1 hypothetical protein ABB26_09970 [Stenotrophomonas humi]
MPIEIELPDGSIAEFPDGMPDAEIEAVIQRQFPSPAGGMPITALPVVQAARPDFSDVGTAVTSTEDQVMGDGWKPGLLRDVAMGGRSVLQGAASLLGAFGGDAINYAVTDPIRKAFHSPDVADVVAGRDGFVPTASYRDTGGWLADKLGLPKPQSSKERVYNDISEALTGTALTMGVGGLLNAGRSAAASPTVAGRVGDFLTAQPVLQSVATATGSGAAGATREAGGGTGAQLAAALAGGLVPGAATAVIPRAASGIVPAAASAAVRRVARGSDPSVIEQTLKTFSDAGVQPSVGQATGNRFLQAAETMLGSVPGSAGRIDKFAQGQASQFGSRIDEIASGLAPGGQTIDPESAGLAIQRGITGAGGFKELSRAESNALYRQLDELIPQDARVDVSNAQAALADLNATIPGAPSTSRFFQNGRLQGIEGALGQDTQGIEGVLSRPGIRDQVADLRSDLQGQAAARRGELAQEANLQRQDMLAASGEQRQALQAEQQVLRDRLANMIETRRAELVQQADDQAKALYTERFRVQQENERRRLLGMNNMDPELSDAEIAARIPTRAQIDAQLPTQADIEAQLLSSADIDAQLPSTRQIDQQITPESSITSSNFGQDYVEGQVQQFLQSQVDGKLPYEALQKLRTLVGREIDNSSLVSDVPRSKWRSLYGALSADMEQAVKATGNPKAVQTFEAANKHHADYIQRLERIETVLNRNGGEDIYNAATRGLKEGATMLREVMRSLPVEDQKLVSSVFIRRMGRAVGSQQDADGSLFSMNTYLTNYANMSPQAKQVLFKNYGPEFAENMETIAKATSKIREGSQVFANPSGTARQGALIGQVAGTLSSAGAAAATGNTGVAMLALLGSAGTAVSANLLSRVFTHPKAVAWLARSTKAPAGDIVAQLNTLRRIGRNHEEPELLELADELQTQISEEEGKSGQ